jgi:hypothetical protein
VTERGTTPPLATGSLNGALTWSSIAHTPADVTARLVRDPVGAESAPQAFLRARRG